jgi:hypothetical protein
VIPACRSGITVVGVSVGEERHRGITSEPYAWSDGGKTFIEALQAQVLCVPFLPTRVCAHSPVRWRLTQVGSRCRRKSEAIARTIKYQGHSLEQQPMRLPIHDSFRIGIAPASHALVVFRSHSPCACADVCRQLGSALWFAGAN